MSPISEAASGSESSTVTEIMSQNQGQRSLEDQQLHALSLDSSGSQGSHGLERHGSPGRSELAALWARVQVSLW